MSDTSKTRLIIFGMFALAFALAAIDDFVFHLN